ncbi:MAG: celM [Chthonomonadaceae bacterium]|nr:celM [Chthonomonadaceae bacterium]
MTWRRIGAMCLVGWGLAAGSRAAHAQGGTVTVTIDAKANRHPISPLIYGMAYADDAALKDLRIPLHRYGGNNATRYNWQLNADNRANDWYFESIADPTAVAGERGDTFTARSKAAGAATMLTIPMIDWVAKVAPNRDKLAGFSIAKYGAQTGSDASYFADAGNGTLKSTGKPVTGNDPNDANVPNSSAFQQDWVKHLVAKWGTAAKGGVQYYLLDNEPALWSSTHRDVQPVGLKLDDLRAKTLDYAAKIKAVDPSALVVGPEEWGWTGYLYSGYDSQWGNDHKDWSHLPDRAAHGNMDAMPWLLDQLHKENTRTGKRLLDVFSLHYYPQGGEFNNGTDAAMQLRRNRSTRSLWDPNYTDETWINSKVALIPRMKNWVSTYYPGTRIGITEYNWGAENHINGATTQADILGIFGREGLDMATRWTTPAANTPTYKAIQIYRNYDGAKSGFGETGVQATVPNPDNLSAFAALRASDGALTVMVINKTPDAPAPVALALANFAPKGSVQVWQLTAANTIARQKDVTNVGSAVHLTVPAQSITLLILPAK